MALGGEVDDRVEGVLAEQASQQVALADIAVNGMIAGRAVEPGQIGGVAGIGQRVENDDRIRPAGCAANGARNWRR